MQVLDLAILAKGVLNGLLVGFLVNVGDDDNPSLDGTHGGRFEKRLHVVNLCRSGAGAGGSARGGRLVDVHLYIGHGCEGPGVLFGRESYNVERVCRRRGGREMGWSWYASRQSEHEQGLAGCVKLSYERH